jgi:hypothetical protein
MMPGIGSTPEPDQCITVIALLVSNLAEAEHRSYFTTPGRIAIPSASAFEVALDAYPIEVKPAHR